MDRHKREQQEIIRRYKKRREKKRERDTRTTIMTRDEKVQTGKTTKRLERGEMAGIKANKITKKKSQKSKNK